MFKVILQLVWVKQFDMTELVLAQLILMVLVFLVNEIITETDGLHIKIDHKNHGMYSNNNLVIISNAQSDVKPTKLSIQYAADSTGSISVDNSSSFSTFENVGVGTTNAGYLLIGDEVIFIYLNIWWSYWWNYY
jgi:hypothetical protein